MSSVIEVGAFKLDPKCQVNREVLIKELMDSARYHNVVSVPRREDAEACANRVERLLLSRMNNNPRVGDFVIYRNDLRRIADIPSATSKLIMVQFQCELRGSSYYVGRTGIEQGGALDPEVFIPTTIERIGYLHGSYWTCWRDPSPRSGVYFRFPTQVWNADAN